ncbi:hypothetical protein CO689_05870 [Staphylococcus simulans]|nr:hypothetical protein AL483_11015 [Staphylococcus simulans]ATF30414.1 hypothetical protein CO689_05870 [Staphylococcus simulans]
MILTKVIVFISFGVLTTLWSAFTTKYLPSSVTGVKQKDKRFDERQVRMYHEIFSRTLISTVYFLLVGLFFKFFISNQPRFEFMLKYPEIIILTVIFLFLLINYFAVKRKYTYKG